MNPGLVCIEHGPVTESVRVHGDRHGCPTCRRELVDPPCDLTGYDQARDEAMEADWGESC